MRAGRDRRQKEIADAAKNLPELSRRLQTEFERGTKLCSTRKEQRWRKPTRKLRPRSPAGGGGRRRARCQLGGAQEASDGIAGSARTSHAPPGAPRSTSRRPICSRRQRTSLGFKPKPRLCVVLIRFISNGNKPAAKCPPPAASLPLGHRTVFQTTG